MYYYFLAGLIFDISVSKVIYIDIDTIIQNDLESLYNLPLSTTFSGARCNVIIPFLRHQNIANKVGKAKEVMFKIFLDEHLDRYNNYINSGVILIDISKLRNVDLNKLFNLARIEHLNDQDLISYYFVDDLSNFDIRYNFCIHFFIDEIYIKQLEINKIDLNQLNNYQKHMDIVHITARPKPSFFFNEQSLPIIRKCGGVTQFVDVISKPNDYINKYEIELLPSEYLYVQNLNKEWANALYSRTKNTRLYEKVYYQ
jgi:lipopolysaccharide biosynthesis glycosyltransferase